MSYATNLIDNTAQHCSDKKIPRHGAYAIGKSMPPTDRRIYLIPVPGTTDTELKEQCDTRQRDQKHQPYHVARLLKFQSSPQCAANWRPHAQSGQKRTLKAYSSTSQKLLLSIVSYLPKVKSFCADMRQKFFPAPFAMGTFLCPKQTLVPVTTVSSLSHFFGKR